MFSFKRGLSGLMASVVAFGSVLPIFSATPNSSDGEYTHNQKEGSDSQVDVNVLVQNRTVPVIFSAYVPATVKIAVSRDKQIITPENLRIINGVDTLPIGVWDVYTKPVNGWAIQDWDTNFKDKSLTDQKKFAMTMNGNDLSAPVSKLPWEIQPAGELPLTLDAKITYQSQAKDLEEIMTVSFTMDWMDRVDPLPPRIPDPHGDIPIDAVHFPDPGFRNVLKNSRNWGIDGYDSRSGYFWNETGNNGTPCHIDANRNGILEESERAAVTCMDFDGITDGNIYDLTGIEYFPNLRSISRAEDGRYTALKLLFVDLSLNPAFTEINCRVLGRHNFIGFNMPQSHDIIPCPIPNTGSLDLNALPGKFDPDRASNFTGCTRVGDIIYFDTAKKSLITYDYDPGKDLGPIEFRMQPTDGAVLPVF